MMNKSFWSKTLGTRSSIIHLPGLIWSLLLLGCTGEPVVNDVGDSTSPAGPVSPVVSSDFVSGAGEVASLVWRWDEQAQLALLGFDGGSALFSIQCNTARRTLEFTRFAAAPDGARATLSLTTPDTVASLPAEAVSIRSEPMSYWRATQPVSNLPATVRRAFMAGGTLRISIAGSPILDAPQSDVSVMPFRSCEAID